MTTDLVIRTYRGDFPWLEYCLRSNRKHLKGFRDVIILCSDADAELLKQQPWILNEKIIATGSDWEDGYLQQQRDKLYADTYTDAEFICHTDSDCIWTSDFHNYSMTEGGKPIYLMEHITQPYPWFKIVGEQLGFCTGNISFMRRHPFLFPRAVYHKFREYMQGRHGIPLETFIRTRPHRTFSEFEMMGNWSLQMAPWHFVWKWQNEVPEFTKQHWSWGGLDDATRAQLEELTK